MAYDLATVTNSGNQLLASVVSDKSSLVIDKIEVSGTQLASSTDLKSMKSISNVVKTLSANGYQKKDTSFIISTVLDNSSVDADYKAWVFGIWAHEADGGSSILMSVITSTSSPDTISKGSGTPIDYNYKFITTFSNTSSLTIQMASDTYATNDTVLHNSGDETATGTKTFQEIKISNNKFPSLVQTDGQYITLNGGNSEMIPANDSAVVHTSDMRKPASDVAGIEEVNVKQDKIGYTPADDSKVVHTADTSNWQKQAMFNPGDFKIDTTSPTTDFATLLRSKYNKAGVVYIRDNDYPSLVSIVDAVVICEGGGWWYAYGITSDSNGNFVHRRINPSYDTGWVINADDSKVAHLSGANNFDTVPTVNNNPLLLASSLPSDLARTGQANTFNLTQTFSQGVKTLQTGSYDDVNSLVNEGLYYNTNSSIKNGAGSITTGYIQVMSGYGKIVRQIMYSDAGVGVIYDRISQDGGSSWSNWVQIVTWDQIPGDLAFTDQDANFTAKLQQNGQDVALANNTIARNPNTGSVSETNTFTAAQTFSIAPTITDASKDKGDNQAATMADLKSVENSAWHQLKNGNHLGGTLLYKIDQSSKRIYVSYSLNYDNSLLNMGATIADFSSIVKNIKTISGIIYKGGKQEGMSSEGTAVDLSIRSPAYIVTSDALYMNGHAQVGFSDGTYFTYDSLQ